MWAARAIALLLCSAALGGCDCGGGTQPCSSSDECGAGRECRDGMCRDAPDAGGDGGSLDAGGARDAGPDACGASCGTECCGGGEICVGGLECARDVGPCASDGECRDDSYCEPAFGRCVPYGTAGRDRNEECRITLRPGVFRTTVQCEWTGPPAGDAYASYVNASSLPLVVDFRMGDPGDPPRPSIVVVTGPLDGGAAIVRVLDGATCAQQATLAEHVTYAGAAPAAGDLDGDGRPEIVVPVQGSGVAAWTWDATTAAFRVLWYTPDALVGSKSVAITLADLDDDGAPEVLAGSVVFAADGTLLSAAAGIGDLHCRGPATGGYATPAIVADVDLDGEPELVRSSGVWAWDRTSGALVRESYSAPTGADGAAAIADFGEFPGRAGDAPGRPEIVSIQSGRAYILTIGGDVVFGPVPFPGTEDGGNPTVADFDGDGQVELATAGLSSYTVFDPDCLDGASRGGACSTARTDGILWTRPIQENSCAIMGSTVFDFEGDGAAEVVYADECYARVFSGRDGTVVWSRRRSSATWIEGPTVADVDGDFHAEMVITATDAYRPSCPALDPIFPGTRCASDADCASATSSCDEGLCRCSADADCGDPELVCAAPLAGMPGTGNVCRSSFAYSHGVRVYADFMDRWAGSRAVWNQHAYSVTNVDDDGTIPRSSAVRRNWEIPGLNNFRQNVQGDLERAGASDLTVTGARYSRDCSADRPALGLVARVCNRGLLGVPSGVAVLFYEGDPASGGTEVCRTETTRGLLPAECEEVTCTWSMPPLETELDVWIRVDDGAAVAECLEENNHARLAARCPPPLE